jgi:hypothetical protein
VQGLLLRADYMRNTGNAPGPATFSACRDDESVHRLASPCAADILNPDESSDWRCSLRILITENMALVGPTYEVYAD